MVELGTRRTTERVRVGNSPPKAARAVFLSRLEEAIEQARYTVNLKPDSHEYLTDLGWSLVEAEYFDEAQTVLKRAVAMSPPDYELARENLAELHRRMRGSVDR